MKLSINPKLDKSKKIKKKKSAGLHAPIAVGDCFRAEVDDLAHDGRGVMTHASGMRIFVPGVWVGEVCDVKITALYPQFAVAALEQIETCHPQRRKAPCPFHGEAKTTHVSCGGCSWMFMAYDAQLIAKQKRLEKTCHRLNIPLDHLQPIQAAQQPLGYRNRAQFKSDGQQMGYVSKSSHRLANIDDCIILTDKNRETLHQLSQSMPNSQWRPQKRHQWTTIDIDESIDFSSVSVNKRLPFQQGNNQQNHYMRAWIDHVLNRYTANQGSVIELFCGSGNFTEVITASDKVDNTYAIEGDEQAIAALKAKGLSNLSASANNLFNAASLSNLPKTARAAKTLILDPPREGFKNIDVCLAVCPHIETVIYISCDAATFSRDAQQVLSQGFNCSLMQGVDLFPQTPHVEIMAVFQKTENR